MKQYTKPHNAIIDKLAAKPSMPSIRFIALSIKTMTNTVSGIPIHAGTSYIPRRPYRLLMQSPHSGNMEAATIWMKNLILAFSPMMSSTIPAA